MLGCVLISIVHFLKSKGDWEVVQIMPRGQVNKKSNSLTLLALEKWK
jgi:hypothetical protein